MDSALVPFTRNLCEAVTGFSDFIFKRNELRQYPEVIALAFWFRAANLKHIRKRLTDDESPKTIHRVFHIAPANVDTVFVYSLLLSVLSGNYNIVRISERSGEITWLLVDIFKQYLNTQQGKLLQALVCIVEYPAKHQTVTEQLSNWCDLRVVWGGDDAIRAISAIAPHTQQVSFPNRYSLAVINANEQTDLALLSRAFLTDVLPFNQQACSSPKAIYWLNTERDVQDRFWKIVLSQLPTINHNLSVSNKVEQHINFQYLAASQGLKMAGKSQSKNGSFARVVSVGALGHCKVSEITPAILEAHSGNGLIIEQDIRNINDIACSTTLQTVSYFGFDDKITLEGVHKRMVPLGKSLNFDVVWDGIDLLQAFN
ncbi:MAG: hypothetical protein HWE26_18395 [Alteromonadaceae bacterium]|nr:hypothetical protein [Alteromonadaceae bacterium]